MAFSSANLLSVDEVIRNHSFIVPEFQRGYAWGREQWQALWDDVGNLGARENVQHYGGTLMVSQTGSDGRTVELVDGQQRMTSISLMLAALGAKGFPITFRDNEALQTYFNYFALGHQHLGPSLSTRHSYYARNIRSASEYFSSEAQKLTDERRDVVAKVLLQRFKLFVLAIRPEFNVHVAFETINNRGRPLSTLEKLKNRLIYLASNANDQITGQNAAEEIHRCWKQVYASLGAGKVLLDDDEFLRAHSVGWFRHERKSEWLSSKLFDDKFCAHGDTTPNEIIAYVHSLNLAAACWHLINQADKLPQALARQLAALEKAPSASSKPLLLWALIRLAQDYPKLIEAPEQSAVWAHPLAALARQAERFGVLVMLANARASNVGLSDINRSAYSLAHPGEPIYQRNQTTVPPNGAKDAVEFAAAHLGFLVYNGEATEEEEEDEDIVYIDPRFPWPGFFSPRNVQKVAADRLRRDTGFYKWQFGKLIVYTWEDRLRGHAGRPEKKPWDKFAWDESVEHIYPQTPHKAWQASIDLDGRSAGASRSAITNSLGNLLLLSRSRNATVSNEPFLAVDKLLGKQARYKNGSYSEMQVADLCKKWTVLQIAARGIAMFRHAEECWDFELVSRSDKLLDWLPLLFGDQASKVQQGAFSNGSAITNAKLGAWVEKFEALR